MVGRLLQARAGLGPALPSRATSSLGFDAVNHMYMANPPPDRAVPGDLWRANLGSRPYDLSAAQLQGSQLPPDMVIALLHNLSLDDPSTPAAWFRPGMELTTEACIMHLRPSWQLRT